VINTIEEAKRGAGAILDRADRPTAILATSDVLAMGAMQAIRERGLDVPRDISVTGFDDIPDAARSDPPLTTVLDGWEGEPPKQILALELVVRASTGPAPATNGHRQSF
jgi:DNA-binding LacI/PurR family transcriptional regulator